MENGGNKEPDSQIKSLEDLKSGVDDDLPKGDPDTYVREYQTKTREGRWTTLIETAREGVKITKRISRTLDEISSRLEFMSDLGVLLCAVMLGAKIVTLGMETVTGWTDVLFALTCTIMWMNNGARLPKSKTAVVAKKIKDTFTNLQD